MDNITPSPIVSLTWTSYYDQLADSLYIRGTNQNNIVSSLVDDVGMIWYYDKLGNPISVTLPHFVKFRRSNIDIYAKVISDNWQVGVDLVTAKLVIEINRVLSSKKFDPHLLHSENREMKLIVGVLLLIITLVMIFWLWNLKL